MVYVTRVGSNPEIVNYFDALYFTVATLTTTGFGDITLVGTGGHILAVLIMIFGISLFLRLIQTIFRPDKVRYECPVCGLTRHDADTVHCRHCGTVLHITTEGADLGRQLSPGRRMHGEVMMPAPARCGIRPGICRHAGT